MSTRRARAVAAAVNAASELTVRVLRAATGGRERLLALDLRSRPLGEASSPSRPAITTAEFDMPVELRNDVARLEIAGEHSAGAVQLLDGRWKRRSVGLVTGATAETALPLLAPNYYLSRALAPFADVRRPTAPARSAASTNCSTSMCRCWSCRTSARSPAKRATASPPG